MEIPDADGRHIEDGTIVMCGRPQLDLCHQFRLFCCCSRAEGENREERVTDAPRDLKEASILSRTAPPQISKKSAPMTPVLSLSGRTLNQKAILPLIHL